METIHIGRKEIKSVLNRHTIPNLSDLIIDHLEPHYIIISIDNVHHSLFVKDNNYSVLKYMADNLHQFNTLSILIDLCIWADCPGEIIKHSDLPSHMSSIKIKSFRVRIPYSNIDMGGEKIAIGKALDIIIKHRKNTSKFLNILRACQDK